jgi:hypothetical protein
LFWNNGKQYLKYDSLGILKEQSVRMSQTIGLPRVKYKFENDFSISAFAYYQMGNDIANKKYNAYDVSLLCTKVFFLDAEKKASFKSTIGVEMLSGTNSNNKEEINNSFTPMYGTNHLHNGYMDFFFVGGRFENSVGLNDIYLQLRYDKNKKWFLGLDIHNFSSNASVYKGSELLSGKFGNEIDLTYGVVFNEDISLQVGYSQMFSSATFKYLQATNAANSQNWMYVMLVIRPKNDKKFIGLLN